MAALDVRMARLKGMRYRPMVRLALVKNGSRRQCLERAISRTNRPPGACNGFNVRGFNQVKMISEMPIAQRRDAHSRCREKCAQAGEINHHDGGCGFYLEDPNGHFLEAITRPYGSGGWNLASGYAESFHYVPGRPPQTHIFLN
jgi:hypothetical protein